MGWGCSCAPPPLSQESQTDSELLSFCREALLTRGPSSLSSLSAPLLFFSADPRGAAHLLLLGSNLCHPPTLLLVGGGRGRQYSLPKLILHVGMFLPGCHLFCTLQTNAPALLRVLLSIMWAEHLLYMNKTHEEYTGIYRIVNGRSCNGDPVNGDRNGSPVGFIAGHFISESVGHPSSPPGLRLAKMHRSIHSLSEALFPAPRTRRVRTEP